MSIPFLNTLPLDILILLGFTILGFCNYLKKLRTWNAKIKVFSNYRDVLVEFHDNVDEGKGIDPELSNYLLEKAPKITSNSIIHIIKEHPKLGISSETLNEINNIVTLDCYNFRETCGKINNMLIQNIGFFKDKFQETKSKIINPIALAKNGVFLIFNIIPIVKLTPSKIKFFLGNLFLFLTIINTLSSLFLKKPLFLSIIRQITTWISPNTP